MDAQAGRIRPTQNLRSCAVANNKIWQYRLDAKTGALSSTPASSAPTVLHPEAITIGANGRNIYVTSENGAAVSQFTINSSDGKISPMSPPTVTTAGGSLGIAAITRAGPSQQTR